MGTITWSDSTDLSEERLESSSTVELLRKARSGDEEALDAIFRRYIPILKQWAHGRLPGSARGLLDTDDLVQDTMMHTVHHVPRFLPHHDKAFKIYLRRSLSNRVRDAIRRAQRKPQEVDPPRQESPHPGPNPLEEYLGEECRDRYRSALTTLRPKDRDLIVARIEKRWSYRQIAQSLGRPSPDAARMGVVRALLRLAERMETPME
ncbi:MAG TPA: sigma-70 family RNA polymerase sigma factor [Acidobacteriota bacterium]|nr:sigma-70 family RNA polymerase sigma factor [Acidobacteriota bacterium]